MHLVAFCVTIVALIIAANF